MALHAIAVPENVYPTFRGCSFRLVVPSLLRRVGHSEMRSSRQQAHRRQSWRATGNEEAPKKTFELRSPVMHGSVETELTRSKRVKLLLDGRYSLHFSVEITMQCKRLHWFRWSAIPCNVTFCIFVACCGRIARFHGEPRRLDVRSPSYFSIRIPAAKKIL